MPMKVLIVDDEPDLQALIGQKFRRQIKGGEFQFVFASNGEEALAKLHEDPALDIVMSDINMPVMDGLTLLSRLSDVDRILKAVIVSAYGDMQNIRTAMNRGAYDFLTKPIDFYDFEVTLNKTIQELEAIKQALRVREQLAAIQQELSVAARIQHSILPRNFPPFPSRTDFAIYAEMIPAREVGGDFYDFFLIDGDRLGFVIGDVSGKGVPAAILMAVTRTLLKAAALQGVSAGECLQQVNDVLVKQSDPGMFVTIFYGILHTGSGGMEYCIGGHNPPYLFSAPGSLTVLREPSSPIVGAFEHSKYETGWTSLNPGDGIFLFTDGVTESMDQGGNEFSEERLKPLLRQYETSSAEELIQSIISHVRNFSAGARQADDITALALRYLGSNTSSDIDSDR